MFNHRQCKAFARLIVLSLAAGSAWAQTARISITTGGVYDPMGGGMANILSKYVSGLQATAQVTGGSVDNLKLLGAGKAEVGFSMVDAAFDAANGADKFKDAKLNVRTSMVLYPNREQVVTIEGSGINKLSDLRGKRVSTGSPGSGVEVIALRVLEAAGLDAKKDLKQERLGASESASAIKDRKIDAFFWIGGVPTAALTDLAATPGVKMKLIDTAEYSWIAVVWIAFTACLGIAALAVGVQRWLVGRLSLVEQWLMILCGLALIYPAPAADLIGLIGIAAVLGWQWFGRKTVARAGS